MQHWQSAAVILGAFLTMTMLLGFAGRVLHRLYNVAKKVEAALGVDEQGKTLRQNVEELKAALNNGIRRDVRTAIDHAKEAQRLAGRAATSSATAEQLASDALRATNALRAEMNAVVNAALSDHAQIFDVLADAGYDRRQDRDNDRPTL